MTTRARTADHHEIERSYGLGAEEQLPDLGAVPGVARVGEPEEALLVATYVDTADLALIRAGVTLRRRTGGGDAGWHLKIPAGAGRDEVHRPLGAASARVPAPLARVVLGWSRGRPLVPVATIETRRTTRRLHDADGAVLAEVCDDVVRGTPADRPSGPVWREVEVELVGADPAFLDDVDAFLAEAGIEPRGEQRKIGTVLGERLEALPRARLRKVGPGKPAGRLLHRRVSSLVVVLGERDCDVRRGVDDGVHQLRVTCRRLRGALATFRPLVDRAVTDPIRDELRWLARTLGDGRDAEVMLARVRALVDAEPSGLVVGPVRRRVEATYRERMRAAEAHAAQVLESRRYLRLRARLEALAADPPFLPAAQDDARDVVLARVERDFGRLRKRVKAAKRADGGPDQDEALHAVRRAAKRLRYACETLEPAWGHDATTLRKAVQQITSVLGDRQDGTVARADLRRMAREADRAGESSFTYGLLLAREEARSEALVSTFEETWDRARDSSLRSWLD